jgi:hypothetical protein
MSSRKNASSLLNKTKTKKVSNYIYYTGIGAKKSGKHTKQEFLNIMNKKFKRSCSNFSAQKNYKPCSERKEMEDKMMQYAMKHKKPYYYNNRTCKSHNKYKKLINKCIKYSKNYRCNFDDYIDYSGAVTE